MNWKALSSDILRHMFEDYVLLQWKRDHIDEVNYYSVRVWFAMFMEVFQLIVEFFLKPR